MDNACNYNLMHSSLVERFQQDALALEAFHAVTCKGWHDGSSDGRSRFQVVGFCPGDYTSRTHCQWRPPDYVGWCTS
eukprot:3232517-Pyramimonas_sp.AAC.1